MARLRFRISISLDGFVAGRDQSPRDPIGVGGMRLHEWVFPLRAWRENQGLKGGKTNTSNAVVEESMANIGATIMGRNMFGGQPGAWDTDPLWNGWWGDDPPYHHPVFVITHYPRPRLELKGGTSFTFLTETIEDVLLAARQAANGLDVSLAGGASVARQYLRAGLIDEMVLNMVPIVLGRGERLFEAIDDLHGLSLVRAVPAPGVLHLKFSR